MLEALGGQDKSLKSACNLVYISKTIASEIDKYHKPLYTEQHAYSDFLRLNPSFKHEVQAKNNEFNV